VDVLGCIACMRVLGIGCLGTRVPEVERARSERAVDRYANGALVVWFCFFCGCWEKD